jgi:hypothetical protein
MSLLSSALFVSAAVAQTPAPTGRIDGAIQTSDGKPVPKATVWIAARGAAPGAPFTPFTGAAQTGADGTFHVNGVPDGSYAVCPTPPDGALSPCEWATEPIAVVANGKATALSNLVLKAGVDLYVRVNDPKGIRAASEGTIPGAGLFLGVSIAGRRPLHIPLAAGDKNGADYHVVVPADTPLMLFVSGRAYDMTDEGGNAVDKQKGLVKQIQIAAGTNHHQEVVNIR